MLVSGSTWGYGGDVWNIATGVYLSKSLVVNAQETFPTGIFIKPDGASIYLIGNDASRIFQYTLSTPWDVSTGSILGNSGALQAATNHGIWFSADGSSAYLGGIPSSSIIHQYTLSTPWLASSATYASKSLDINTQETQVKGLAFSADGSKVYVVGTGSDTIFQYTLSTPWDVSTGSYSGKSLNILAQTGDSAGLFIDSSGTRVYVPSTVACIIYQYTLGTAWDISTGSYAEKSLNVSAIANPLREAILDPEGAKMYAIGSGTDTIYQYVLGV